MPADRGTPVAAGPTVKPAAPKLTKVSAPARSIALANRITAPEAVATQNAAPVRLTPANARTQTRDLALANRITAPISVAASLPKIKPPRVSDEKVFEAAIKNFAPTALIPGTAKIGVNLGKDIVSLPSSTIEGVSQLGEAGVRSIEQGSPDPFLSAVGQAAESDPLVNLVEGHVGRAAQLASAHPLGVGLDLLGGYGALGKAAGAAARLAPEGSALARAASLAREPRYLPMMGESSNVATHQLENLVGAQARGGSANLFTRIAQRVVDNHAPEGRISADQAEHAMRVGVATDHAAESGIAQADRASVIKQAKAYKPAGRDEANLARLIIPYGTKGTGDVRAAAQAFRDEIARNGGDSYGVTAKTRAAVLKQLDSAIANPNLDHAQILRATQGYGAVQDALENRLAALDTYTHQHMDAATRAAYLQQQPGVHYLDLPTADPRLQSALKDAKDTVKARRADLADAGPANAETAAAALRQALADRKAAKVAVKANPMKGTLIEDPSVPAITAKSSPLLGMRVRPVTEADYQAALAHEPEGFQPSHLTARNLLRDRLTDLRRAAADNTPQLAEAGRAAVTGEAAKVGDLNPGWGGVVRSQLNTVNALRVEREMQNFMARYADPSIYGKYTDAARAAEEYESTTRIPLQTLTWKGGYRNVPKAALDELTRQFKADNPGRAAKLLTKPNHLFSRTVLAMSPKLPVMHSVENLSRTALMEHGNLLRIPADVARGRAILNAADQADPELGARLRTLLAPGGLSHSGVGAIGEDAGKLALEHSGVRAAAQRFVEAAGAVPRGIITLQRSLEKPAQLAALGAHGRQLVQEWGSSWMEANAHVQKYAEDLAHGLADPAEAQRAAAWMHKVDGQYNAFTGRARMALRFVPFGSWYVNAARLVMVTLPKDHPLFEELVQATAHHNQQQWDAQHAGLPADMQASLPVGDNAYLDIGKFTPIGVQDPSLSSLESTGSELFLPWITGPAEAALAARGPFMEDLYGPNTPYGHSEPPAGPAANMTALEQIAEEFGGPLNVLARALYGHGGTMYNVDTPVLHLLSAGKLGSVAEKPGSQRQRKGILNLPASLDKVIDPFHPTTYHAGATATASAGLGKPEGTLGVAESGGLGKPEGVLGK